MIIISTPNNDCTVKQGTTQQLLLVYARDCIFFNMLGQAFFTHLMTRLNADNKLFKQQKTVQHSSTGQHNY